MAAAGRRLPLRLRATPDVVTSFACSLGEYLRRPIPYVCTAVRQRYFARRRARTRTPDGVLGSGSISGCEHHRLPRKDQGPRPLRGDLGVTLLRRYCCVHLLAPV